MGSGDSAVVLTCRTLAQCRVTCHGACTSRDLGVVLWLLYHQSDLKQVFCLTSTIRNEGCYSYLVVPRLLFDVDYRLIGRVEDVCGFKGVTVELFVLYEARFDGWRCDLFACTV